ncbi:hypothetical protein PLESTM_000663800 [Pleodorina starrii]|nr:hypothetical protein PLESTM_000663800 [Pleodorina starrii]
MQAPPRQHTAADRPPPVHWAMNNTRNTTTNTATPPPTPPHCTLLLLLGASVLRTGRMGTTRPMDGILCATFPSFLYFGSLVPLPPSPPNRGVMRSVAADDS